MTLQLYLTVLLLLQSHLFVTGFNEFRFNEVKRKLEADVIELASEAERLYAARCDEDTMVTCRNANYGVCQSLPFPNEKCLTGETFRVETCGASISSSCAARWDHTMSSVSIPGALATGIDGNPGNPEVVESICFSRKLDDWFVQKRNNDADFWSRYGLEPTSMYFGSYTGTFRIYPARQWETDSEQIGVCGMYDPRLRPWFVAASSGPKNVALIVDTSESMNNGSRLLRLKEAAERIISTLTSSDRILIVPFSSTANPITTDEGFMFKTTKENKAMLIDKIKNLDASGNTNFYDAFSRAFDVLEKSLAEEKTVYCNTAILFLTDGENTQGPEVSEVTALVQEKITSLEEKLKKPVLLFTYSIGTNDVHEYPKQLACSVQYGLWSKITDDDEIVESFSSYYRLLALGLGSGSNDGFTAWSEPYVFQTGGALGTTVSAPVYDRSKTPHLFLGVVGIDVLMDALDAALGTEDGESRTSEELRAESIRRIVLASEAACPNITLSSCAVEEYRRLSAPNEEALCDDNCTGFEVSQVQAEKCRSAPDYPNRVFVDGVLPRGGKELPPYDKRVCCFYQDDSTNFTTSTEHQVCFPPANNTEEEEEPDQDDDDDDSDDPKNILAIVLGTVCGIFVLAIITVGSLIYRYYKQKRSDEQNPRVMQIPPRFQPTTALPKGAPAPSAPIEEAAR